MTNLPINLKEFGFVEREFLNGRRVKNKCGRDFLYYALHYYFPNKFNPTTNNPLAIDKNKTFGQPVPELLAWLMIQFYKVPSLFKNLGITLVISGKEIKNFSDFLIAIIRPTKKSAEDVLSEIEKAVDGGHVAALDMPVGFFGLLNHVMFVYGYDEENLYILDTQKIPILEYEKMTEDNRYLMRLSKEVIKRKWGRFGRVWIVRK